jgi:pimeloyl-ACP methyl ester carboxylesterase
LHPSPSDPVSLRYELRGDSGDPLLLLHGGWEDRGAWETMLPVLSTGFQVVACDRRGHGTSAPRGRAGSVRTDADDLAQLLESVDLFPIHVGAHGSAAASALRLAADRPELVRSVLLHEPPFLSLLSHEAADGATVAGIVGAIHEGQRRARAGELSSAAAAYLAVFGALVESWERFPLDARHRWESNARAWADESDDPSVFTLDTAGLGEIGTPVLVTVGEASPEFAHRVGQQLVQRLPNATLASVPESGHLPQIFAPATLTGVWAEYLLSRDVPST